jgi:hypothetical protein
VISNDRAPTIEEISKLVEYPDRRIKPMVYTMISSGIRLGAWDYLRWGHVKPIIDEKGELLAARLVVYAEEQDQYYSFISPEAFRILKEWMEFRASYGETINENSWLLRDLWQVTNVSRGAKYGLASYPKKLKINGIKRLLANAIWEQGLRVPLKHGKKRHEWKAAHGFRKFYKTHAEQMMKPINVEITMGHNVGLSSSYYKPTEREVLEDYVKAIDLLTVNSDKILLKKQVIELREKCENNEYIIKGKLQEKDEQIQMLTKKQEKFEQLIQSLIQSGQLRPVKT